MAFLVPIIASNSFPSHQQSASRRPRRTFLQLSLCAAATLLASEPSHASLLSPSGKQWNNDDLCLSCVGKGQQSCSLCDGTGIFSIDDSVVQQEHVCPNCMGNGTVRCPACIGLGLKQVNGILRNGVRNGSLRMLRNGQYEILDCSAFPACDIYGASRRSG